jgi:hypothetical protein
MEPARLVARPKAMRVVAVVVALLLTVSACSGADSRESSGTPGLSERPGASTIHPGALERGPLAVPSATEVLGRWRAVRVEGEEAIQACHLGHQSASSRSWVPGRVERWLERARPALEIDSRWPLPRRIAVLNSRGLHRSLHETEWIRSRQRNGHAHH